MTEPKAYTAEELEAIGREHSEGRNRACTACVNWWPCPTARLLATVAEGERRRLVLAARLETYEIAGCCEERNRLQQENVSLAATVEAKDAEIAKLTKRNSELERLAGQLVAEETEHQERMERDDIYRECGVLQCDNRILASSTSATEAENAALKAQVEELKREGCYCACHDGYESLRSTIEEANRRIVRLTEDRSHLRTELDLSIAKVEKMQSTIEAQGQEIERLKADWDKFSKETSRLGGLIVTKDAILRECAKVLESESEGWKSDLHVLAAKCEAAIGEK